MTNIREQHGISMIELLISLAISSFLILGITQVYIDNKSNQVFQGSQIGNLENSRFSGLVLNQYLAKAGYRRNPSSLLETAFPKREAGDDCLEFKAGHSATGLDPNIGSGFCIRYQPQVSGELDCQGNASTVNYDEAFANVSPDDLVILAFKYEPNDTKLEEGRLLCKSLNATAPQYSELVRGIADLRLEFGVGTADALDKEVAFSIAQRDWTVSSGTIHSIRYSLLLASGENMRDAEESMILTNWLSSASETTKSRLMNADKHRIYEVASSTQTLRNLMP
ncbi:PilW family protein [Pseudomonas subflava]|uniref:PilW family protein n=1 Tax=Pseudomonas subflava TaxID=2952933 RepID=UPI0020799CFA|nr:PilW family protein [Pseudomonas subflava]